MKGKDTKTEFQGPVSLDAIYAATSKVKSAEIAKDVKVMIPVKKEEKEDVVATEKEDPKEKEVNSDNDPAIEKVEEKVEKKDPSTETDSYRTAKRMIDLGLLDDFTINTSDEDEKGTPISEFISMTEENLKEIINIQKQEKSKEISSKYIPKEGLKEHQLKVIEILKNGGDLTKIAKNEEEAFKRPFEGFDMEVQERQIDVLYTDLTSSKNLSHDKAIHLIKASISSGNIESEAQEIFDKYRKAHADYIDEVLKKQKAEKDFKDLNFKENKKSLIENLKNSGIKEDVYKKVASEYSKKNEEGDYALVDKLRSILDNPEDNHELILHLVDKNLFNQVFRIKASQESQKTIIRLATGAASKGNRGSVSRTEEKTESPWEANARAYNENIKRN